jgi:hypothetical protein
MRPPSCVARHSTVVGAALATFFGAALGLVPALGVPDAIAVTLALGDPLVDARGVDALSVTAASFDAALSFRAHPRAGARTRIARKAGRQDLSMRSKRRGLRAGCPFTSA